MTTIQPTEEMQKLMQPGDGEDFGQIYVANLKAQRDHWEMDAHQSKAENRQLQRQIKVQGLMIEQLQARLDASEQPINGVN